MSRNYRLPKDTRAVLSMPNDGSRNFRLDLSFYAPYFETEGKFKFWGKNNPDDKHEKEKQLIRPDFSKTRELLSDIRRRQKHQAQSLFGENYSREAYAPDWRVIVGIGAESVYETSISLHHVYGIPYIPASAIKGVTRSYAIATDFECEEGEALQDYRFCQIFGNPKDKDNPARQGKIMFLDAFPDKLNAQSIEVDVMNPHYPKYYQGSEPPTDTQSPNPIPFLTVADTTFLFILGVKSSADKDLLKTAQCWLHGALTEHGIGAKTAVGYGYMNRVNYSKEFEREKKEENELKQQQQEAEAAARLAAEDAKLSPSQKQLRKLQGVLDKATTLKNEKPGGPLSGLLVDTMRQAESENWLAEDKNHLVDIAEAVYNLIGWGSGAKKQEKKNKIANLRNAV
jgi:CRISPR-associated protein Cmr6